MRVITADEKAEGAAVEWMNRYCSLGKWSGALDSEAIYKKLKAMSPPTAEKVNEIIGNNSWTTAECTTCGARVDRWLQIRVESYSAINVCSRCLSAGHKQMFPNGE